MAVCAPHSIAATQAAWAAALLLWIARFAFSPRPALHRTPIDYALLGFFALTFLSALLSYDPDVSTGKLRAASLFTIVYLVAENIASRRALHALALTLIASCMINVIYTFGERAVGRGVKVKTLTADSPLRQADIREGDTLLEVNNRPLRRLEEVERALAAGVRNAEAVRIKIYRFEWMPVIEAAPKGLLEGATAAARLGVADWSRGRDWRAAGFYGHYATYAEVLQLILSLALGLLVTLRNKFNIKGLLLVVAVVGMSGALLLTVTRASWLAFLLSAFIILLVGASRRTVLALALGALLVVPIGLFLLQQKRNVGFFDRKDPSTTWRTTVYREGVQLLISNPRHLLVGIGMDSIKRHWREWKMFDNGRLPIGHMHSTPLQLALERGIPALVLWLILLIVYVRMLLRLVSEVPTEDWIERGIVLGGLGGLVGFCASGIVHYNLGDSEVAMVFYLIMGFALVVERQTKTRVLGPSH